MKKTATLHVHYDAISSRYGEGFCQWCLSCVAEVQSGPLSVVSELRSRSSDLANLKPCQWCLSCVAEVLFGLWTPVGGFRTAYTGFFFKGYFSSLISSHVVIHR